MLLISKYRPSSLLKFNGLPLNKCQGELPCAREAINKICFQRRGLHDQAGSGLKLRWFLAGPKGLYDSELAAAPENLHRSVISAIESIDGKNINKYLSRLEKILEYFCKDDKSQFTPFTNADVPYLKNEQKILEIPQKINTIGYALIQSSSSCAPDILECSLKMITDHKSPLYYELKSKVALSYIFGEKNLEKTSLFLEKSFEEVELANFQGSSEILALLRNYQGVITAMEWMQKKDGFVFLQANKYFSDACKYNQKPIHEINNKALSILSVDVKYEKARTLKIEESGEIHFFQYLIDGVRSEVKYWTVKTERWFNDTTTTYTQHINETNEFVLSKLLYLQKDYLIRSLETQVNNTEEKNAKITDSQTTAKTKEDDISELAKMFASNMNKKRTPKLKK